MPCPNSHDDTSADYEQFEKELLGHESAAARVGTVDADDATAQYLGSDHVDVDVVTPIPEDRALVHE